MIENVQKKADASGSGGHFMVDIYGDKAQTELIARIDAGPNASIIGQPGNALKKAHKSPAKDSLNKKLNLMKKLLGDIIIRQYMAEIKKDKVTADELKIQAEALTLKIGEVTLKKSGKSL